MKVSELKRTTSIRKSPAVSNVLATAIAIAAMFVVPLSVTAQTAGGQVQTQTPAAGGTATTWLQQARTAMVAGNYDLATHYISLAEIIQQQQPSATPLEYTPEMARSELASLQAATQSAAVPATASAVPAQAPASPLPSALPAYPANEPVAEAEAPAMDQQATAASQTLLRARQALAAGDIEQARQAVDSARSFNVDFDALGDSPRAVDLMIFHQDNLLELYQASDPDYNQRAAVFLMEQARALINYRDFDSARTLVTAARQFPVDFNDATGNPDQLLQVIDLASSGQARMTEPVASAEQTPAPAVAEVPGLAEARRLLSMAQLAKDREQWDQAWTLAKQASSLNVPDSAFESGETLPWEMELQITQNRPSAPVPNATQPVEMNFSAGTTNPPTVSQTNFRDDTTGGNVVTAEYIPQNDTTRNVAVAAYEPLAMPGETDNRMAVPAPATGAASRAMELYRNGLQALESQDQIRAREYFELAWSFNDQMDETTRQSVQDHLAALRNVTSGSPVEAGSAVQPASATMPAQDSLSEMTPSTIAPALDDSDAAAFSRLQREVFQMRGDAERLLKESPRQALEKMNDVRSRISSAEISAERRRPLLTIIDRDIADMQSYIDKNISEIMNSENNANGLAEVDARRQRRYDIDSQISRLVDDINNLLDERRYAEADSVARQAMELDPNNEAVAALMEKVRVGSRVGRNEQIADLKERGFWEAMEDVDKDTIPLDGDTPILFSNDESYQRRAEDRLRRLSEGQYDSEAERQIWNLLRQQQVQGEYRGPLNGVISQLARQADVNIVIDRMALDDEEVSLDMPVDATLNTPIALRSALNIVLDSAGLVFVVEDEVIKVTTRNAHGRSLKTKTYYVGDLVMPVTNFGTGTRMEFFQPPGFGNNGTVPLQMNNQLLNQRGATSGLQMATDAANSALTMGQQLPGQLGSLGALGNGYSGGPQTGIPTFATTGPPSLGGVTLGDFQPLTELIKQTIEPDTWTDANGEGQINPFVSNLSLIVSQTQEIQDQIQDLLEKLRELNDVQIVVEVRFVSLRDDFFERVGVDFDFQLNDFSGLPIGAALPDELPSSVIIGQGPQATPGTFAPTADLDVGLLQNTFAEVLPQIGGFSPNVASSFGFAILSDIEVFFLLEGAKGDTRSNIMQAPTVTMFNGQSASVQDGFQRPFVTSVTPVVGDFAVAHQPIITIIPDGTSLNVNAVVSPDRRFVRMTLVPYFSQIDEVETFTFDGSTTTRVASDSLLGDLLDQIAGIDNPADDLEVINEGVTIQLPVVAQTTVSTVVSVPDGGTVLLGGVKRMNETRLERGLPFLSNIPYINRLFKNVGIGRETANLMLMVSPTIIIQEEEERAQVGPIGGN